MTAIRSLSIDGIRNLRSQCLDQCSDTNIITGENGSGKTSILEAISILSTGRSFRHRDIKTVIHHESSKALVTAKCERTCGEQLQIGVEKRLAKPQTYARVDGQTVATAEKLSFHLPVAVWDPRGFQLFEGGPVNRRELIDWILFHVKQEEFTLPWRNYRKAIEQRNALLKSGVKDRTVYAPWEAELINSCEVITYLRNEFVELFQICFQSVSKEFMERLSSGRWPELSGIQFSYQPGWNAERRSFAESLDSGFDRDLRYASTVQGPHRADLLLSLDGFDDVRNQFSRGQLKTLLILIRLTQRELLKKLSNTGAIYLLDDISAELDAKVYAALLESLASKRDQLFVTTIELGSMGKLAGWGAASMFHVKHGQVTQA